MSTYKVKITKLGKRFKTVRSKDKDRVLDMYDEACQQHSINDGFHVQLIHHETDEVITEREGMMNIYMKKGTWKIFKAGIKREQGWLYYLNKNCNIVRS